MYTKGEWKWEWESGHPTVRAHDPKDPLKLVATVYPKQRKEISFDFLINEAEANAQLIASAPDLYEALKAINASKDPMGDVAIVHNMVNALRKAEGK